MTELTVPASVEQIEPVTDFVNQQLDSLGCPEDARVGIDIAIDEIFSNIARYAYGEETGWATVRVESGEEERCVTFTFTDCGKPFDPLTADIPDTTRLPAKQRPIGGLGLLMVKKIMDDLAYTYQDGKNILTMRKKF